MDRCFAHQEHPATWGSPQNGAGRGIGPVSAQSGHLQPRGSGLAVMTGCGSGGGFGSRHRRASFDLPRDTRESAESRRISDRWP